MSRLLGWGFVFVLAVAPVVARAADILVAAPSSMIESLTDIGRQYERAYPGHRVHLINDTSDNHIKSLERGIQYDVLITVDQIWVDRAQNLGLIQNKSRKNVARNAVAIALPKASTNRLYKVADLARPEFKKVAFGDPETSANGRAAKAALESAGVWPAVSSKALLITRIQPTVDLMQSGQVDAAFVFGTDIKRKSDQIKPGLFLKMKTPIQYPAAVCLAARNKADAQRFIDYLQSSTARRIFQYYGFMTDYIGHHSPRAAKIGRSVAGL